eukprot:9483998-Heterocapsa_arctica.AAC.1
MEQFRVRTERRSEPWWQHYRRQKGKFTSSRTINMPETLRNILRQEITFTKESIMISGPGNNEADIQTKSGAAKHGYTESQKA